MREENAEPRGDFAAPTQMSSRHVRAVSARGQLDGDDVDHGREATRPGDIPAPGWRDVVGRVRRRIADDDLSIVAAGVAFYALIATFPGLLALLSIYGLILDRGQWAQQLDFLRG